MKFLKKVLQYCMTYFVKFRQPVGRRSALFIQFVVLIQILTLIAPKSGDQPMRYGQIDIFWNVLHYVFRPDTLITTAAGTGIATVVSFLIMIIFQMISVQSLTRWFRRYSKSGSNFMARFDTFRTILDAVSQFIYRLCVIPVFSFTSTRIAWVQGFDYWDHISEAEIVLSWILAVLYLVGLQFYAMFSLEYSWTKGCYFSAARSQLIRQKAFGILVITIMMAFLPYENNKGKNIVIFVVFGLLQMVKFFATIPYHWFFANFFEILQGELLLLGGLIIGVREQWSPNLHVPLCLLVVFTAVSLSTFLWLKAWVKKRENSNIWNEEDFEIHIRKRVQIRTEMQKENMDLIWFDQETFEFFQKFEQKNAVHSYFLVYHFHYFSDSHISINHTMLYLNRMYSLYKNLDLIVERKRCLAQGKRINSSSIDAKDVYYASKYFIEISDVLKKDENICKQFPLLIDYFYKNVSVNMFSEKMVPLFRKIENTKSQYEKLTSKNYSKGLTSMYGTYVDEIIGDHQKAQDIMQNIHNNVTIGRNIDYLDDKNLVLFIHASGPNSNLIQSIKGCEILGYTIAELQGVPFSEIIPRRFQYWHEYANILTRALDRTETNPIFLRTGLVQFVDKFGFLVPMEMKMRVMISKDAELLIAVIATTINDFAPFAFLEKGTITAMSMNFHSILIGQLQMENKHEYTLKEINPRFNEMSDIVLTFDRYQMKMSNIKQEVFNSEVDGIIIEKMKVMKSQKQSGSSQPVTSDYKSRKTVIFEKSESNDLVRKLSGSEEEDESQIHAESASKVVLASNTDFKTQRMLERINSTARMFSIFKIGVFICVMLLLAAGVSSTIFIKNLNEKMELSIDSLVDQTIRRFYSVQASMRAKEYIMIENGYTYVGTLEQTKDALHVLGNHFQDKYERQMEEDMIFQKYRVLNDDPSFVWHEYMAGRFHERMISVKDMLSTMSTLCFSAEEGDPEALMTLYRNGASDAMVAFNQTIDVYTQEFDQMLGQNKSLIITLLVVIFTIICIFSGVVVVPIFIRINRQRAQLWTEMQHLITTYGPQIKNNWWERLVDKHGVDAQDLARSHKKHTANKYGTHWVQIRIYVSVAVMFLGSAGYLYTVWDIGQIKAAQVLEEKRDVTNWAGYRRQLCTGVVFWQREVYLEQNDDPLQYKNLIPEFRYHYSEKAAWEQQIEETFDTQHKLLDVEQLLSGGHEDLLLDDAWMSENCNEALKVGLHIGILELLSLSSNVIKEFKLDKSYQEAGGLEVEKLVTDIFNPLQKSFEYYKADSEDFINGFYEATFNITVAYSILNVFFYFLVLFMQVRKLQEYLVAEIKLIRVFQKDEVQGQSKATTGLTNERGTKIDVKDVLM